MIISNRASNIRTIHQGDPKFMLKDNFVMCPRAGFEINEKCPSEYRQILMTCIDLGWLKPVAHVYGKELTMDAMR
jgi:hypothetical protein